MALSLTPLLALPAFLFKKILRFLKTLANCIWKRREWLNYEEVHLMWICAWSVINTIVFAAPRNMSFIDALVFGVSTATVTSLNPANMSTLKLGQQLWTCIAIRATSTIGIALLTHLKRWRDLRKYPKEYEECKKNLQSESRSGSATPGDIPEVPAGDSASQAPSAHGLQNDVVGESSSAIPLTPVAASQPGSQQQHTPPSLPTNLPTFRESRYLKKRIEAKEFGEEGQVARHGQLEGLNALGRLYVLLLEYRSQIWMLIATTAYVVMVELVGIIVYICLVRHFKPSEALDNGTNTTWVAAYHSASATFNFGLVLVDAGMVTFRRSIPWLIISTFQRLAGNMMLGPFLRWMTRLC